MAKVQELAIKTKKEENISEWYTEVIQKADLIEYTDVSGCMIFKPNSYQIWESIQIFFNEKLKKSGIRNAYFPMLIPEHLLTKEEEHVEGFTPEVAWVTHAGESELKERLAIRPTSETIMYPAYSKWIKSYRDLPLRLNQWANVVRWEFKHPTPFMRNREFLWQEGHTAFATKEEADREILEIIEYYRQVYEELLAVPVTPGYKSVKEKFAGADYSTTIEPLAPDGKVIQAGTAHHLGQNFSKAFDVKFLDKDQKPQYVYQNSWGISTRTIAGMILTHSDNRGLVLPPKVAFNKVVIVPLLFKGKEEMVLEKANEVMESLSEFNPILDDDTKLSPGFKFNKWEMQGMPIRLEIGPRDVESGVCMMSIRDLDEKQEVKFEDVKVRVKSELEMMHKRLFDNAKNMQDSLTTEATTFDEMQKAIESGKRVLVPWCESIESEEEIKEKTGAKTSCIPFEFENRSLKNVKCFYSSKPATCFVYFSKSY